MQERTEENNPQSVFKEFKGCSSLNDLMTLPVNEGSDEENDEDVAEDPEAEEGE